MALYILHTYVERVAVQLCLLPDLNDSYTVPKAIL
jgi:hypothetical protein